MTDVAAKDLDAEIAEHVFNLAYNDEDGTWRREGHLQYLSEHLPQYSTGLADAWLVVAEVQRRFPGWRFMLIGGDESYVYRRGKIGEAEYVACPEAPREIFGWRASFFGHIDPTQNFGARHGDEHGETPSLAICRAAIAALDTQSPQSEA